MAKPKVQFHKDGYYLVVLQTVDDCETVLSGGPYSMGGHPIVVKKTREQRGGKQPTGPSVKGKNQMNIGESKVRVGSEAHKDAVTVSDPVEQEMESDLRVYGPPVQGTTEKEEASRVRVETTDLGDSPPRRQATYSAVVRGQSLGEGLKAKEMGTPGCGPSTPPE